MKKLFYTFLSVSLIFSACNPLPNTTLTSQNIYSVIDISNSPDGTYSFLSGQSLTQLQVLGGSFSYTGDTWTIDWISGNTISCSVALQKMTGTQVVGCADVEIRTYNNTNLINTENFQIGYSQLSPPIFCDNLVANNYFTKVISIVAD